VTVGEFAERVVQLAGLYPLSGTSWGRTMSHNAQVGGVYHSAHRAWLAVDLIADGPLDETDLVEMGRRLELRVLPEGDHYHVQPWTWEKG
jgi:hypothetical protein